MRHLGCSWREVQEMPERFSDYIVGEMKQESERARSAARRQKRK